MERLRAHQALSCVAFYRRNLPHWHPRGKALFITWRLHRSIEDQHCLRSAEIASLIADADTRNGTCGTTISMPGL